MQLRGEIDKSGFIPVYHQIAQALKEYIQKNSLESGDAIPSERELCEAFEVSRMTVRQAVDVLVHEGVLVRHKGKGTFVQIPKLSQPLTILTSFTMDMINRGMVPTSNVLHCEVIEAPEKIAKQLELAGGEKVIRLVRVRCANNKPHAYECSYLLYDLARPVIGADLTSRSLYDFLSKSCGLDMRKAREIIEVSYCSDEVCNLLLVPKRSLAFHIERITYDNDGCPVEYVESYYRTDKFKFDVELELK